MQYGAISDSEYFILKIISIRISGSEAVFWGDLYQSMDWTINSSSWDCIQEPLIVVYQSDTNTKDRSRLVPQLRMPGMHNKKLFWFSLVAIVSREMRSCSSVRKISSYNTLLYQLCKAGRNVTTEYQVTALNTKFKNIIDDRANLYLHVDKLGLRKI